MTVNERPCFMLYHNFANQFGLLPMEERGILITAIFEYTRNGTVGIEMPPVVAMAFSCVKDTLDRDQAAYLAKCERNRENGKKGGRPRKDTPLSETDWIFEKSEKGDKEKDMDKDKDTEKDKDTDMDTEWEKESPKEKGFFSHPLDSMTPSAPSTPSAPPPSASLSPTLSEGDRRELKIKGIPDEYVAERLERAHAYAERKGRSTVDVLWEWWRGDEKNRRLVGKATSSPPPENKSYDVDDFFQAALERSYRQLYGEEGG